MLQQSYEIVVLKPTAVFLSFLAAQLPGIKLPELRLLQIDNTAYTLPKKNSEKETLEQIEVHFLFMLRHEVSRWLGNDVQYDRSISFLDFVCFFKFELHSHFIMMESSVNAGQQALFFRPRIALLHWLKAAAQQQEELLEVIDCVELAHLQENATVMIKNFSNLTEIKPFLYHYYKPLFSTLMSRFSQRSEQWPVVDSVHTFSEYFAVEIHTQLIHLAQ